MIVFHGMTADFNTFTDENVGNGNDQEGPGIYLSNNENDASTYCRGNGFLYTVEMNLQKTVEKISHARLFQKVSKLIEAAPNKHETLMDWDENPSEAWSMVVGFIMEGETAHDVFQSVWYEFYRNSPVQYIRNMVKLGYDGVIVPKTNGIIHYIVFNPNCLTIKDKRKIANE